MQSDEQTTKKAKVEKGTQGAGSINYSGGSIIQP